MCRPQCGQERFGSEQEFDTHFPAVDSSYNHSPESLRVVHPLHTIETPWRKYLSITTRTSCQTSRQNLSRQDVLNAQWYPLLGDK